MPNHITNILEFSCTDKRFNEIAEYLRGDRKDEPLGTVDFNVLKPMPASLQIESGSVGERGYEAYSKFMSESQWLTPEETETLRTEMMEKLDDPEAWELGKQYFNNLMEHGAKTWYDWSYDNWGTKWNAYDCEPADAANKRLCFLTAWCAVPDLIRKIAEKFPDVGIVYSWADEDIGHNVGTVVFDEGELKNGRIPEDGSREAYELAADILGEDLGDMGFVLTPDGTTYEFDMGRAEMPVSEHPLPSGEER